MINLKDRVIPLKIIELTSKASVEIEALIDTGASTSCIPKKTVTKLNLKPIGMVQVSTVAGQIAIEEYCVGLQIKDKIYNTSVVAIDALDFALIGWDILGTNKIFPNLIETVFEHTLSLLKAIPELKKNVVLILGQDTSEIHRLHSIRETLKSMGYDGIIVKEISDIEIQSVEEKVNMLASLSRFIICDNSFTSGHIDELKICASNRFTTAIIQEENRGATWMQADYSVDYNFMQSFTYSNISKIPDTVKQSVTWAEKQLKNRTDLLNSIYHWRKT